MSAFVLDGPAHAGFTRIGCSTDAEAVGRAADLAGPGGAFDLLGLAPPTAHDLLVLGADEYRSVQAAVPVLVARPVPVGSAFPGDVLVVSDGTTASRPVIAATVALLARHTARPLLLHVGRSGRSIRHELAEQAATLRLRTGAEPVALSRRDVSPATLGQLTGGLRIAVVAVTARCAGVIAHSSVPVLVVP